MGSALSIEDWNSFKILGSYELVEISKDFVKFTKEGYVIQVIALDIQFDMAKDHLATLSFSHLHEIRICKDLVEGGEL